MIARLAVIKPVDRLWLAAPLKRPIKKGLAHSFLGPAGEDAMFIKL